MEHSSQSTPGMGAAGTGSERGAQNSSGRSGIADKIRETASSRLSTQKDRATEGLGSVAQAVRQSTQQLRDQKQDTVARFVEQAADQIERFSTQLKNKDVGELMNDAHTLARRQPALFIGGAFAIGLLGARFLKSSADNSARMARTDFGRTDVGRTDIGRTGIGGAQLGRDYKPAERW